MHVVVNMQNIKDLYIFLDLRALRAELANKLFYLQQTVLGLFMVQQFHIVCF